MLQVKHFPIIDGKIDHDSFNEFMHAHAPKQNDKQSGLIINPAGILCFYEEGELSVDEKLEPLREQNRKLQMQIVSSEPMLRLKMRETHQFAEKLKKLEAETVPEDYQARKKHTDSIESLKKIIEENEAWILTQNNGQLTAREQIEANNAVIEDIKQNNFHV